MNHDPVLHQISLVVHRSLLFVLFSLAQALALWLWLWTTFEHWTFLKALRGVADVWPLTTEVFASVMAIGVLWIGCANTAVVYLMLGR